MYRPRILIADDEEHIRCAMSRWFSMRGFDTEEATDGLEAVEKCENGSYDIVTMDLEMPRMKGNEAVAIIKKRFPSLPIVVLTGYTNEKDDSWRAHVNLILAKPISLRHLEEEIRQLLVKG